MVVSPRNEATIPAGAPLVMSCTPCQSPFDCLKPEQANPTDVAVVEEGMRMSIHRKDSYDSRASAYSASSGQQTGCCKRWMGEKKVFLVIGVLVIAAVTITMLSLYTPMISKIKGTDENQMAPPSNSTNTKSSPDSKSPSLGTDIDPLSEENVGMTLYDIVGAVSSESSLSNLDSPQSKAVQWMIQNGQVDYEEAQDMIQRYTLLAMDFGFHPESFTPTLADTGDECEWVGITCDDEGRVESIDWSSQSLKGEVVDEVVLLKALKSLDLRKNEISGDFPNEVDRLRYLETLRLSSNNFDSLPDTVCNMLTTNGGSLSTFRPDCGICSCCTSSICSLNSKLP